MYVFHDATERGCGVHLPAQAAAVRPPRLRLALHSSLYDSAGRVDRRVRVLGVYRGLSDRLCHHWWTEYRHLLVWCVVRPC